MKTVQQIGEQTRRVFTRLMERGKRLAKRADPATGGSDHLTHNWGNDAARAAWADTWLWVRRADRIGEVLYAEAEHREHVARGWKPHWCQRCKG